MGKEFEALLESLGDLADFYKKKHKSLKKSEFVSTDIGWPLPTLSMRYLFQNTCLLYGRILHIVGEEKCGKTSFCFDLIRRFLESTPDYGFVIYVETEGKLDREKMKAFLYGLDDDFIKHRIHIYEADTLEDWVNIIISVFKAFEEHEEIPLLIVVDSLRGVTSTDIVKTVSEGVLERSAPVDALKITKFLEVIRPYLRKRPYLLVMTNHLKRHRNPLAAYSTVTTIGGGKSLTFMATWTVFLRKGDTGENGSSSYYYSEISMHESNICETGRSLQVPVIHKWIEKTGDHCAYYDWEAASSDLLLNKISIKSIKDTIHESLQASIQPGKYNKPAIVSPIITNGEKWSFSKFGAAIEERPELLQPIELQLRIIRSLPYCGGELPKVHEGSDDGHDTRKS